LGFLSDTHCHLYFDLFENDLDEVLNRAWDAGITRILIPGTDLNTSFLAVRLAERDSRIFAAVGVHPNDALTWDDHTRSTLLDLARHPKVVAIGEIGLDYYRDYSPHILQREIFETQLDLAAEVDKPVILHNRQSMGDLWTIVQEWRTRINKSTKWLGVLHSFDGTVKQGLDAFTSGFFLGVGGPITFHKADERREITASLPLESLLLETDAPYLAPQLHRGQRNEPAYIHEVSAMISKLHNLSEEAVAQITLQNSNRLFSWGVPD
jgi:TatD DNase family protein